MLRGPDSLRGGMPYRELLYWRAFHKIERDQMEQENLARTAQANLPNYRRKL